MNYIIGPKKLKRSLYTNKTIPSQTQTEVISIVRDELIQLLDNKLNEEYVWLASCTVAVQGGYWGGETRRQSREKLLELINLLGNQLGLSNHIPKVFGDTLPERWSRHGLHYGYGAYESYARSREISTSNAIYIGIAQRMINLLED